MKAKQLAQVIRKIVREEVQKEVRNVLTEQNTQNKGNLRFKNKEKLTLAEALTQTETESYPTMKEFTSADARAGFTALQQGSMNQQQPQGLEGHNGRVIPTEKIDPSLNKAMTRDYSELVKRFKKK